MPALPANLAAALDYERRGWSVIALHGIRDGVCTCGSVSCASPGKHPTGPWKHRQEARATPSELSELFVHHPHANVGIVTGQISGLFVLDIDDPSIFSDEPMMVELARTFKGPTVITGRAGGGFHLYFKHPGFKTANFAKRLPGLDGRGDGGYVVAAPSIHASGKTYLFADEFGPDCKFPEMPDSIRAMVAVEELGPARCAKPATPAAANGYGASALAAEIGNISIAEEGTRNDTLNRAAYSLGQICGDGELHRCEVEQSLVGAALAAGLSEAEARVTAASGIQAGIANPRSLRTQVSHKSHKSLSQNATVHSPTESWDDWSPLERPGGTSLPYPIEALPPVLLEAVLEYHPYGQQPLALVACAAIGNLALAAQARANVARDSTLSGPISLNFMTIAESGERKTTVDRAFGKAVRAWEREQKDAAAPDITAFKAAQQIFEAKMDGLRRGLSGASSGNGKFSPEALEQQIKDLQAREPRPPLVVHLLYEDVTIETLLRDMAAGWPSSAWWSDEGGIVVGGHSFSSEKATYAFACVNRMWDGTDITSRSRVTTGSFEVRGRRLTVSFAFQWTVLTQLIGTGQGASRGTGFLARFLMALPESTMGTRFYKEPPAELPMMRAYESMIRAQLESGYAIKEGSEDSEIDPPTLLLSRDAKIIWTRYYDDTERELQANGDFEDVKDFASKSADNAARLAALFHLARGRGTNESIADGDMKSGCVIAAWHLNEARRIMGMQPSQQEEEAQRLLTWLVTQGGTAALRDVLHTGPSCFRGRGGAGKRDAAIAVLVELVLVRCEIDARIQNIQVHPGYLSQVAMRRAG